MLSSWALQIPYYLRGCFYRTWIWGIWAEWLNSFVSFRLKIWAPCEWLRAWSSSNSIQRTTLQNNRQSWTFFNVFFWSSSESSSPIASNIIINKVVSWSVRSLVQCSIFSGTEKKYWKFLNLQERKQKFSDLAKDKIVD